MRTFVDTIFCRCLLLSNIVMENWQMETSTKVEFAILLLCFFASLFYTWEHQRFWLTPLTPTSTSILRALCYFCTSASNGWSMIGGKREYLNIKRRKRTTLYNISYINLCPLFQAAELLPSLSYLKLYHIATNYSSFTANYSPGVCPV